MWRGAFARTCCPTTRAMPSEHRLHPSSILFALGGSLKAFALPAVVVLLTSGRTSPQPAAGPGWGPARWMNRWMPGDFEIANWQFWILLFLVPATIVAITRYFSFRLRYEGTELVIRSGIFFRNERHVPYARIQNLDAVRNVVHRLLGVTEVRIETGGGQAPEATISVLHETVFKEMRRRIFEGRAALNEAGVAETSELAPDVPALASRTLLHLPLSELLLLGVLDNRGMILIDSGVRRAMGGRAFSIAVGSRGQRMVRAWPRAGYDPADCRGRAVAVGANRRPAYRHRGPARVDSRRLHDLVRAPSLRVQTLARRRGPAHGVRTSHASHGNDSAATRADADDSRGAASASGEADVSPRGNGGRPRLATGGAQRNLASGSRRSSDGPPCLPSCATCFLASMWTCSTGIRCIRERSAGR